jgi:hypothetical protein
MKTTKEILDWQDKAKQELVKKLDNNEIQWSSCLIELKNIEGAIEMFHDKLTNVLDGK